jgi:peptidoglycan hydrolase-like protein with peptidoglycan-binding domain
MKQVVRIFSALLLTLTLLFSNFTAFAAVLRSGDKGEGVTQIQAALVERGFLAEKDAKGSYNKKTVSAIKAFQEAEQLEATGVADVRTQVRLLGAGALGEGVETLPPLVLEETGEASYLGIYGLTGQENGAYAFPSIFDQAVIDLYASNANIRSAIITVDFDGASIEISLAMSKGVTAKKAKSACEKAASLLGTLAAANSDRGYEPADAKETPFVRLGTLYNDYNLILEGFDNKGDSLCYGVKSRQLSLAWRP